MAHGRTRHQPGVILNREKLELLHSQTERPSLVDRIFEMLLGQIRSGNLCAGQRVHSVRQLAESCEVSRDTVSRAYDKLVAHGHLESRAGSGFYVRQSECRAGGHDTTAATPMLPDWDRLRLLQPVGNHLSSTGLGLLPADWMDEGALGSALRIVARASSKALAEYTDPLGYLPLRQQLQEKLKDFQVQAPVKQIMITMGASDALNLIVMSFLHRGGAPVLYESPGPFMLMERLMAVGIETEAVPRLTDGPDLEALRALCEEHHPQFFFCSSVLQSPTSTQLSAYKAFQLLRMAEEFNFIIVEDDTYCDLLPPAMIPAVTRLVSLDQLQRVIYIGSFSKTIAPGLRSGYVCARPDIMERLLVYRTVSHISGLQSIDKAIYQLLSQGSYRHHCAQLRSRLDALRQPVMAQLADIGCTFDHTPEAGMYVWAKLPGEANAARLAETLYQQGHLMAPGRLFSSDEGDHDRMRFNISRTLDSPALPALAKLLKS